MDPIRYSRIPDAVLYDPSLQHVDIRVFGVLANHAFGSNLVWLGQRRIAELARIDRRTVRHSLKRLAHAGHISCAVSTLGRRNVFQLNSKIFSRDPNETVIPPPEEGLGAPQHPLVGAPQHPRIDNRQRKPRLVSLPKLRA